MYAEKQQGTVYFKAKEKQKGIKIDLATGTIISQASGQPYKSQKENHLRRLFVGEQMPQYFNDYYSSILLDSEALAIVALYSNLDNRERENLAEYATILQMVYNRRFEMTFQSVIQLVQLCRRDDIERVPFVNFVIENNIHNVQYSTLTDYAIVQGGIEIANLTETQRSIIRRMVETDYNNDKIKYIVRKMVAEHIEYVIGIGYIMHFFELCEQLEQPYNQKNFLNGYAGMRYLYEMKKEELMLKKVSEAQKDIFKLDTEELYCVMPTTPQQFDAMGRKMSNCIAGYYENVARGRSIIVFVYDRATNEPIINIELNRFDNRFAINQFLGMQNSRMVQRTHEAYYKAYQAHLGTIKPE